uniref:DDE-1 domain-containing protein n=1 Tax=Acrobeloides nanus TaxID=290746 RepID=A0A914D9N8_9BILA
MNNIDGDDLQKYDVFSLGVVVLEYFCVMHTYDCNMNPNDYIYCGMHPYDYIRVDNVSPVRTPRERDKKRRKSYTAEFKLKVVKFAEKVDENTGKENGNRAAGREYGVTDMMVGRWRKDKAVLKAMPQKKRASRRMDPKWPVLERRLKKWVLDERAKKRKAKRIAREEGIEEFVGGSKWCFLFMKRSGLSVRATTSVGQNLPAEWEEKMARFRTFVNQEKKGVKLKDLGNMDEVPVSFDMPGRFTVDERGKHDIAITTTGAEKNNFTTVLCVTADGGKCKPTVIFKRKTMPKEKFPDEIVVKVNEKGWMNEYLMGDWSEEVWNQRRNASGPESSLLTLDAAPCHITDIAKEGLKATTKIAVIPTGMTKLLQPLDISVNKSFKSHLRNQWERWMVNNNKHTYTRGGKMRHASLVDVCEWILEAWKAVTPECIRNGFRKMMGEEVEESDDEESDVEMEELGLEVLPDELVAALGNFHIYSDEEFDGFDDE